MKRLTWVIFSILVFEVIAPGVLKDPRGSSGANKQPQDFYRTARALKYNTEIDWKEFLAPFFTSLYEYSENQLNLWSKFNPNAYGEMWKRIEAQLRIKPINSELQNSLMNLGTIKSDQNKINDLCDSIWRKFGSSTDPKSIPSEQKLPRFYEMLYTMVNEYFELHIDFLLQAVFIGRFRIEFTTVYEQLGEDLKSLERSTKLLTELFKTEPDRKWSVEFLESMVKERTDLLTPLNTQISFLMQTQAELKNYLRKADKRLDVYILQRNIWAGYLNSYTGILKSQQFLELTPAEIKKLNSEQQRLESKLRINSEPRSLGAENRQLVSSGGTQKTSSRRAQGER